MAKSSSLNLKEKKVLKAFGDKVRALRHRQSKTVYDMAGDDMPIKNRQHWQMIENGQKNISLITVYKVAETLEVDVTDLFK